MELYIGFFISMLLGGTDKVKMKTKVPAWLRKLICYSFMATYLAAAALSLLLVVILDVFALRFAMLVVFEIMAWIAYKFVKQYKKIKGEIAQAEKEAKNENE